MWREGTSTADFADAVANVSHVTLPMDGADRVTIPDTELLFSAKYSRAGSDLVLTGADGHKLFVTGYFDHEKHADLVAPGGASLSADLVAKLTISQTPGQYAQAGAPAGGTVIGKVERLGGTATVQHANGTVEELHVGDAIYQGDVIETGGGSQLGLSLNDGTAFNMGASARMVLNELTYDTAGSANAGIFSLVRGSISFVAGQVAKNGDMRVETPVATMGIRGTTVNTTINADINGNVVSVTYSLMADPDGHIGSFNLLDKTTGAIIGTISATDTMFVITPSANLSVLAQQLDKSPEQVQQELAIAQMLFPIFLSNPANFLTNPNPNVNPNDLQPKKGAVGSGGYLDYQGHSTGLGDVAGLNVQTTLVNETVTVEIIRDNGSVPETVTQTVQVPLPNNFAPLITGDTPPHLKEDPSNFENGSTSVAQLTKSDIDGTATYDVAALLAAGWTDNHNGTFSKDGQYGTATLNTNTNTLTYQLDQAKADPLNVNDHRVEDFTIPVVDNQGATNSTVVSFTIDGANDAPTTSAVTLCALPEDHGRRITQSELLANAHDVDNANGDDDNLGSIDDLMGSCRTGST
jgi:VCBS repeat-containing protein